MQNQKVDGLKTHFSIRSILVRAINCLQTSLFIHLNCQGRSVPLAKFLFMNSQSMNFPKMLWWFYVQCSVAQCGTAYFFLSFSQTNMCRECPSHHALHLFLCLGAIHKVRTQHGGGGVSPKCVQLRAGGGGSFTLWVRTQRLSKKAENFT